MFGLLKEARLRHSDFWSFVLARKKLQNFWTGEVKLELGPWNEPLSVFCGPKAPRVIFLGGPARKLDRASELAISIHLPHYLAVFSFLYFKKIKISKIYVGFGKFQKYTPVAL